MTTPLFFRIDLGRIRERTRDGGGPYAELQLFDGRLPVPGP